MRDDCEHLGVVVVPAVPSVKFALFYEAFFIADAVRLSRGADVLQSEEKQLEALE